MDFKTDLTLFSGKASDIAYKSPFGDTTNKNRSKLLLFSSIAILNYYFPLDFNNSVVLGVKFQDGDALSLSGLIAFPILYLTLTLAVNTFQEIEAWLAQARSIEFSESRRNLHDIYSNNQSLKNSVILTQRSLLSHEEALRNVKQLIDDNQLLDSNEVKQQFFRIDNSREFLDTACTTLKESSDKIYKEVEKAERLHRSAHVNFQRALRAQFFKIGLLETVLPFSAAAIALIYSIKGFLAILSATL